jgi:hypothetical protein
MESVIPIVLRNDFPFLKDEDKTNFPLFMTKNHVKEIATHSREMPNRSRPKWS